MSDFTSSFWPVYITAISLGGIFGCVWLLWLALRAKVQPDSDNTTGHVWDGDLREMNNPMPRWWMGLFLITVVFALAYLYLYPGLGTYPGALQWTQTGQFEKEVARGNEQAAKTQFQKIANRFKVDAIAVGNGTASRETADILRQAGHAAEPRIPVYVVSEDGASVYSASKTARDEFPDEDVTVRGAVSIGRRLMDPLAELVKIDPKSIGVGQYQHDVDQTKLKKSLDTTVESCVNLVGVNVNTASLHLLTYISGLGPTLAKNIVDYRRENGAFTSRAQLKKVPRLGPAAFEQCAGFLRVDGAKNPLDNSAVHPERYAVVENMAKDLGCSVGELIGSNEKIRQIPLEKYVTAEVGMPTLNDIVAELEKPGRDPREDLEEFAFDERVHTVADLVPGMLLPGIVTNITKFGAFVDVGVHQDGLVHVSQLANRFVADPAEVVKLHQHVQVKVVEVDIKRNRISLTMKGV